MTNEITDHQQYLDLLAQIDRLFDDYETNKRQIDQLVPLVDKYEENASYFASFNQSLAGVSNIQALLRVLMDQHGLGIDDFQNELRGPGDVTAILTGQLTPRLNNFWRYQIGLISRYIVLFRASFNATK